MDLNQAAQMIEWLDEERRRDKRMIVTLEERLAQQQDTISSLQNRLGSVESNQTVMESQFVPTSREQELFDQMRNEMQTLIDSAESRRRQAERDSERRTSIERHQLSRPVQELTEKISKLERSTTEMPAPQAERITNMLTSLQTQIDDIEKRLEEPNRRLSSIEEQRRQDARRMSEVETTLPEIQRHLDTVRPKLSLIEDLALRNERKVQETQNNERDRREQIQQFIDQQSLVTQQRDLEIKNLFQRFQDHDASMQRNMERFEEWSETYRAMKQIIEDFQRIGDRLERRINEVAEMQRLSEERFRQEWDDWRNEDQKRWRQFTLSNDEVWRIHDKEFEQFVSKLDAVTTDFKPLRDSLDRIWQLERERAQLYSEYYQSMLNAYDTPDSNVSITTNNPNANDLTDSSSGND